MITLFQALALGLVIEGVMFILFPGKMRRAMLEAASLSDQGMRSLGAMALATALIICLALRL